MTEKRLVLPKIELKFKIGTLGYSILMNIMIMLFMILFFYARYDCEIDIAMQSMLYGVSDSGKPCAYLIFSNIVLGKILMILMGIAPKIAWYTVFHYVMILVSLIVISYIIISRNDNSVGHMIAMIVAVFIGYECYIMPVYIKTAAVLTAASFMLWWYLYQAKEKPFKKTTILAVEFLGILGSLVSWKIFLGTSFMMIVVLFFCFYKKDMNPDLKKLMKKLLPLGIMLGISIMFWAVDYSSYAHRDHWSTTVEYKGAVEKLYAFGIPEYQDIDSWLESGKYREIDEKAYRKIRSGIFSDEESVLEFVSVISSQYVKMHRGVCSEIFHNISMRLFRNGMFYLWLILALRSMFRKDRKRAVVHSAISLLLTGVLYIILYFIYAVEKSWMGMLVFLPAVMYMMISLENIHIANLRYMWVYWGLIGIILYYIFEGTMLDGVMEKKEVKESIEAEWDENQVVSPIDFNQYMKKYSIYSTYPKKINSQQQPFKNGVYSIIPGYWVE